MKKLIFFVGVFFLLSPATFAVEVSIAPTAPQAVVQTAPQKDTATDARSADRSSYGERGLDQDYGYGYGMMNGRYGRYYDDNFRGGMMGGGFYGTSGFGVFSLIFGLFHIVFFFGVVLGLVFLARKVWDYAGRK